MTTLAPLTPARQPFGLLSDIKVRNLQSIKNRQNAILPSSEPSLKRRAPSPELSDSENIDPNVADSMGKRKRSAFDDDVSLCKPSRYNIHVVPAATKPRLAASTTTTPRLDTLPKSSPVVTSAPAAAGRSPTRGKRMGLLKPGKRFAPPAFGSKSPSMSITAALKGTLAHKKAKKVRTIEESKPQSWFFDIFEESEATQDYNMMAQSAVILDISDDEGKALEEVEDNKENVDPNQISLSVTRSMSAADVATTVDDFSEKDMIVDEIRTPLGDLNPSKYYGEGLDATSVILVHDDNQDANDQKEVPALEVEVETEVEQVSTTITAATTTTPQSYTNFTFESVDQMPLSSETTIEKTDLGAFLAASEPFWPTAECEPLSLDSALMTMTSKDANSIDIWESESAKDENEKEASLDECGAFTLQEL